MEENLLNQIPDSFKNIVTDDRAFAEEESYAHERDQLQETDNAIKDAEIKRLLSEIDRYKEDTLLRRALATTFTIIIALWLLSVILILVGNNVNHYNLSDTVLTALLITSTANVIGMMLIILNNLFPSVAATKAGNNKNSS